jgi:hypothetical protein
VNATVHGGLDERSDVLVLNRTLSGNLVETSTVRSVSHRLVLKVTLSSLVANRAVQRVVCQQKLHNSLPGLVNERRVGLYNHTGLNGPATAVSIRNVDFWE